MFVGGVHLNQMVLDPYFLSWQVLYPSAGREIVHAATHHTAADSEMAFHDTAAGPLDMIHTLACLVKMIHILAAHMGARTSVSSGVAIRPAALRDLDRMDILAAGYNMDDSSFADHNPVPLPYRALPRLVLHFGHKDMVAPSLRFVVQLHTELKCSQFLPMATINHFGYLISARRTVN